MPWPAITSRVVEGVDERHPRLGGARARGRDAVVDASRRRRAPSRRARRARLDLGDRRVGGHEDLARHPARRARRRPAPGRGCRRCRPTTPRAQPSSPSAASLASAPRILNEPVRCRFSALSTTVPAGALGERARGDSIGVRRTTSAIVARAPPRCRCGRDRRGSVRAARRSRRSPPARPCGSAATPMATRAGGSLLEEPAVDLVDLGEGAHVGHVDGQPHGVGERRARGRADGGQVRPGTGAPARPACRRRARPTRARAGSGPSRTAARRRARRG